jgi:hypothetical protein
MDHRRFGVTFTMARGSNDARSEADKRNFSEHIETFELPSEITYICVFLIFCAAEYLGNR